VYSDGAAAAAAAGMQQRSTQRHCLSYHRQRVDTLNLYTTTSTTPE